MKIEVLSIQGLDQATIAWRLSRDLSAEVSWQEVYAVDVPVNEMPTVFLHCHDLTILEREIFATPRNHVMWARTSHVDDPLEFVVPEELQTGSNSINRSLMRQRKREGASQDEWREKLPVTSLTSFTTRISFRDLVKLAEYFMYLAACPEIVMPLRVRFEKMAVALGRVLDEFTGSSVATWKAIDTMQKVRFLHEGAIESPVGRTTSENFHLIRVAVPLWLRAQIVRHRPLAFVDDFFHNVLCHPFVLDQTISRVVLMELSASKDYWRSIMSKRSCWIAQDSLGDRKDPWQAILDQFGFDESMLPCAGGTCPYAKDASLRLTPADPGAPCPIYCDIAGEDKAPHREIMIEAARSRHPHWINKIMEGAPT